MVHDDDPTQSSGQKLSRSIGTAARRARARLELTQETVSEMIGVSSEFYARIERGCSLPSISTFCRLMTALGVTGDELLGLPDRRTTGATPRLLMPSAPPLEDRELRRLARRLRQASPRLLQLVSRLLKELEDREKRGKPGRGEPDEQQ